MKINSSKLLGLRVETKSGTHLGSIQSFDVAVDEQTVLCYYVRPTALVALFSKNILVSSSQVVSIDEKKMVVDDAVVPVGVAVTAPTSVV
ncbi:MAG: PRC-barrel domain-containing protein [Patescibacteria group bacterium]|jgi:sporulation protein YlmC with PRC-barrel domain